MKQLGRYRLLDEVARGGMGVVYRAEAVDTGEVVAIKLLLDPNPDPRFEQEAQALARLDHPGIVGYREQLADPAGRQALVMEWVAGESLKQRLDRSGVLALDEVLALGHQLCAALAYAHARGVLHRDLKPHNVLLTADGTLKLTDFGLGKLVDPALRASQGSLTAMGDVLGTPAYMSPEQATGDKQALGPRTDVYGLGATLYALLTGRPPFQGATVMNTLHAVLTATPEPPSSRRGDLVPAVDALILRCLAKDPAERFASVAEVEDALASWEPRRPRREPLAWVAPSLAVVLALTLGVLLAARSAAPSPPPSPPTPATPAGDTREDRMAALLAEASACSERGDWTGMRRAADALLQLDPAHARGYQLRSAAHWNLKDPAAAQADARRAIELVPETWPARAILAHAAFNAQRYAVAAETYTRTIEDIDDPETRCRFHLEVARCYELLRDAANVHASLTAALADHEDAHPGLDADGPADAVAARADLHLRLGRSLLPLRRVDDAYVHFEQAVTLSPGFGTYVARASARVSKRDYEGSLRDLDVALAFAGEDPTAIAQTLGARGLVILARAGLLGNDVIPPPLPATTAEQLRLGIAKLDEAEQLHPRALDAFALTRRGQALACLADLERAWTSCQSALAQAPELLPAHVLRMRLLALRGNPAAALELADKLVGRYPIEDVHRLRVQLLGQLGRPLEVQVAALTEAREHFPEALWPHDSTAALFMRLGRWEAAEKHLDVTCARAQDSAEAHYWRGLVRAHLGDLAGAGADLARVPDGLGSDTVLASLRRAVREADARGDPDDPLLQRMLTAIQTGYGPDPQAEVAAWTEVIALAPTWSEPYLCRSQAQVGLGELEAAIADHAAAIEHAPPDSRLRVYAWAGLAHLHVRIADHDAALHAAEQAVLADPRSPHAHATRASVRKARGDFLGVVTDCDRAIELDPDQALAFVLRGEARLRLGQREVGLADLRRALELGGLTPAIEADVRRLLARR